jgi:Zn-dependent alcohol dehydrogenase
MKTRAAVHVQYGQPMVVDEVILPDPGPDQVVVKQFASGVCHSQLHQLHNPQQRVPALMGHESTGVVVAKGNNVTHLKEGDRCLVTWVHRDNFDNAPPAVLADLSFRGQEFKNSVFTWAEDTIADQRFVVKMDDNDVATDVTAIIGCAVMTGCGAALNTAGVRHGQSVAVFGVGGVGLCIIQAAANAGAYPVIAVDLAEDKLLFAKRFGATHGFDAANAVEQIRELTGGGADFAFDAIGLAKTTEQSIDAVRPGVTALRDGGTAVLVGLPYGPEAKVPMWDILRGKTLRGSIGGSSRPDRDFPMYVRWFKEGRLPLDLLVTRRYRLDQINEAVEALHNGEITGRAILEF